MTEDDRPLRRDAQRNRERILVAAAELVAARGITVSYDDIADAAGVGVGTVYRHFPSRDDLLAALFRGHIDHVVELAELASAHADPVVGLHEFLNRMLERQAGHRGLADVMRGGRHPSLVRAANDRVTPVVTDLLARARGTGGLGADVVPGDLVLIEFMVTAIMDASGPQDPQLWRRALGLLIAGLGVRQPLPEPVPDANVIDRLYTGA